jgi:thymidylate synthase
MHAKELIHSVGDAHVYFNHISAFEKSRHATIFSPPSIEFVCDFIIFSFTTDNARLKNYKCGSKIKYEMAI